MPQCTICGHQSRVEIDAALLTGALSVRAIAHQYSISRDALMRHSASHLAPQTAEVQRAIERDVLAEVERLIGRVEAVLTRAERKQDDRLLLLAAREVRSTLELLARLRGELSDAPTVNILVAPEWLAVRTALLAALAPYSEARAAAATALLALEPPDAVA